MTLLNAILTRFNSLYPLLLRQKVKESQAALATGFAKSTNAACRDELTSALTKLLSIRDRLRLVASLAKSEVQTLQNNEVEIISQELLSKVDEICAHDLTQFFSDQDIFVLVLFVRVNKQHNKMELTSQLLTNLIVRAQAHMLEQSKQINDAEDATEREISMEEDAVLSNHLILVQSVLKSVLKTDLGAEGSGTQTIAVLKEAHASLLEFMLEQQKKPVVRISDFAPRVIWFEVLTDVFEALQQKKHSDLYLTQLDACLQELLATTFNFLQLYKDNSKYYVLSHTQVAQVKVSQQSEVKVRRMSKLFTEILDCLVGFVVAYLTSETARNVSSWCQKLFDLLLSESVQTGFTLVERLSILNSMNQLFFGIPEIVHCKSYWALLQAGMWDKDIAARKLSINVLKTNLQKFGPAAVQDVEGLWSTFFDIYDTLESFGSHLTKAIWHRVDLFYNELQKHEGVYSQLEKTESFEAQVELLHPLRNFKMWLLVLYGRAFNHMNLKIHRFVLKATLSRKFITVFLQEFFFEDFLAYLNDGLIFKDYNLYTVFSKNAHKVVDFYVAYFRKESKNLGEDLRLLFEGFTRKAQHPQLVLITLKVLSEDFNTDGRQGDFIGSTEIASLLEVLTDTFAEQFFSNRYLCLKFSLKMMSRYLKTTDIDWSLLFKLLGQMPLEFFSFRTICLEKEAIASSAALIEKVDRTTLQKVCSDYLQQLFTTKAMATQMPKWGKHADLVLKGIANCVLLMTVKYEEPSVFWFLQTIEPCRASLEQALSSTYLAHELVESKIRSYVQILGHLYKFGSEKLCLRLRDECFVPLLPTLLARVQDQLLIPLSREESSLFAIESEKIDAAFASLTAYTMVLQLGIQMTHLDKNQSHNALEVFLKTLLNIVLKVTASNNQKPSWAWGRYLLQASAFELFQGCCESYTTGIKECIKKDVNFFFVPDDLFEIGKLVLQNLISFKSFTKPNGADDITNEQNHFFIEQDKNPSKINMRVNLLSWKLISHLSMLFQYDSTLKAEMASLYNPQIAAKTVEFLSCATDDYCSLIFTTLKTCFLPTVLATLKTGNAVAVGESLDQFKTVTLSAWAMIKEQTVDIQPESLQEFLEFVFAPELLESYHQHLKPASEDGESLQESILEIKHLHDKLASEMIEHGNKYWLVQRSFFNHLMFMIALKPHLLHTLEHFVAGFGVCREVRSADAELKLYKLQMMIPQVIPKKYENLPLEQITYQGAYVRSLTLLVVEGVIKSHNEKVKTSQTTEKDLSVVAALEKLLRTLFAAMKNTKLIARIIMPYCDEHRQLIRTWQFLMICLQVLDPVIYTVEFRNQRKLMFQQQQMSMSSRFGLAADDKDDKEDDGFDGDIVQWVNDRLWEVTKTNIPSSVRRYVEVFTVKFVLRFPDVSLTDPLFFDVLMDPKITKPALASSMLLVVGFVLTAKLKTANAVIFKKKIFEHLVGFASSNSAHSRCIAQFFLLELEHDKQFGAAFFPVQLQPMIKYLKNSKDVTKMMSKYKEIIVGFKKALLSSEGADIILCEPMDEFGEFVSAALVDTLRVITTETVTEFRCAGEMPQIRADFWKIEFQRRLDDGDFQLTMSSDTTNFQRKILPWEQIEFDNEKKKRLFSQRKRNEIIICASLIDKIPNLAGLARTCEIMNASSLVLNNASVTTTDEFKGISVTSEKWLPIYEVLERDLTNYLQFQKSNGYQVLGLEQTANSKMLHEFKFPSKVILLLGKEKEGIPQEYYGLLDACIEIPQFGIIRSLNVHVSGALCLWEYTKQHMRTKMVTGSLRE